jgi:hypothetical protein
MNVGELSLVVVRPEWSCFYHRRRNRLFLQHGILNVLRERADLVKDSSRESMWVFPGLSGIVGTLPSKLRGLMCWVGPGFWSARTRAGRVEVPQNPT